MAKTKFLPLTTSIPTLAMVDAFVGGVAVLLILIIISNRMDPKSGEMPQANVIVGCTENIVTLEESFQEIETSFRRTKGIIEDVASWLAVTNLTSNISNRVRIDVTPDNILCSLRLVAAIKNENAITDGDAEIKAGAFGDRSHITSSIHVIKLDE